MMDGVDGGGTDEGQAAADLDHQAGHRRIRLVTGPAAHDVAQPADLGAGLVADGPADDAGQGDDGVADGAVGQQALAALAAPGRAQRRVVAGMRAPAAPTPRRGPRAAVIRRLGHASGWEAAGGGRVVGPWGTSSRGDTPAGHRRPPQLTKQAVGRRDVIRIGRRADALPSMHAVPGDRPSDGQRRIGLAHTGGCGDAPAQLGGSPRFIGHTSSVPLVGAALRPPILYSLPRPTVSRTGPRAASTVPTCDFARPGAARTAPRDPASPVPRRPG